MRGGFPRLSVGDVNEGRKAGIGDWRLARNVEKEILSLFETQCNSKQIGAIGFYYLDHGASATYVKQSRGLPTKKLYDRHNVKGDPVANFASTTNQTTWYALDHRGIAEG